MLYFTYIYVQQLRAVYSNGIVQGSVLWQYGRFSGKSRRGEGPSEQRVRVVHGGSPGKYREVVVRRLCASGPRHQEGDGGDERQRAVGCLVRPFRVPGPQLCLQERRRRSTHVRAHVDELEQPSHTVE